MKLKGKIRVFYTQDEISYYYQGCFFPFCIYNISTLYKEYLS